MDRCWFEACPPVPLKYPNTSPLPFLALRPPQSQAAPHLALHWVPTTSSCTSVLRLRLAPQPCHDLLLLCRDGSMTEVRGGGGNGGGAWLK